MLSFIVCQTDPDALVEIVQNSGEPWSVQFIIIGLLSLLVALLAAAGVVARAIWIRYVKRDDALNEEKKKFAEEVKEGMRKIIDGFAEMQLGFQRLELIQEGHGKDLQELSEQVKINTKEIQEIKNGK